MNIAARFASAFSVALALAAAGPSQAAYGSLDCSFGVDGSITVDAGLGFAFGATAEPTGNILIVSGLASTAAALYRTNVNGSSLATLGGAEGSGFDPGVVLQPDGKILTGPSPFGGTAGVRRVLSTGAADSSFGSGGLASVAGWAVTGSQPVVQPDGGIVAGGAIKVASSEVAALVRFNSNGTPDSSFGTGGVASNPAAGSRYRSIALQPDGSIVAIGDFALARHTATGQLDPAFGTGGVVNLSNFARQVRIQPSGMTLVIQEGVGGFGIQVSRYTTAGALDFSRMISTPQGTVDFSTVSTLSLTPDGRPVLVGRANNGSGVIVRLNVDLSDDVIVAVPVPPGFALTLPSGRTLVGQQRQVRRLLGDLDSDTCLASSTTLTSTPNPSVPGELVTLTATVSAASGPVPQGTVQFKRFGVAVGSPIALVSGVATLQTSTLPQGDGTLTAVYSSSGGGWAGSTSPPITHTVSPSLTINDPSWNASSGATLLTFTVTLGGPIASTVTVNYATVDRTAKAGTDYTATSGTLTFAPGDTTKLVQVPIAASTVPGPNKDFFVTLAGATNAGLSKGAGIGTLVYASNGALSVYIDDPSVEEGFDATTLLGFTLSLSRVHTSAVTVEYATADGSATAGTDYVAASGTVTFAPGQTQRWVLVPILANAIVEADRNFFVNLSNATGGAVIAKAQGTGTILDDDPTAAATTVPQYRLYSDVTKEHLYTTDANEYAVLGTLGWVQEGTAYTMFGSAGTYGGQNAIPLYRLYHPGIRQHHWTTDANEVSTLVMTYGSWQYERIPGYVLPVPGAGTTPLYRLSLPSPPLHLWTTDLNEKNVLTAQHGWVYEGTIGEVLP